MAGTSNNNQFDPQLYLSPTQQDLLLAALASNNPNGQKNIFPDVKSGADNTSQQDKQDQHQFNMDMIDPNYYTSPQLDLQSSNFGGFGVDDSPYGDFLDGDTGFDLDNQDDGSLMIGALPGESGQRDLETEGPEKRKSPSDEPDDPEGGGKRREGEDKTAKKPGRKPLTSEPTTKRKAQNRAAQRAFRERKEKHLKDLETKVAELEKASDAANHENGLLRAQVQRLQTELREYRKRLSLNSAGVNRSPSSSFSNGGFASYLGGGAAPPSANFQFEFPRFGSLPGSQLLDNASLGNSSISGTPNTAATPSSGPGAARSVSPRTHSNSTPGTMNSPVNLTSSPINSSTPGQTNPATLNRIKDMTAACGPFGHNMISNAGSMFDNGLPTSDTPKTGRASFDSSSGQSRIFQFNSATSVSNSNSPSASSMSQFGQNSSCGTSPEPSHNSPGKANESSLDTINNEGYVCHGNSEGEVTFCEKLNMACGNPRNPIPRAMSNSNATPATGNKKSATAEVNGIDILANQNGGQFDPLLFGDYRESQAAIVGDGEFTGGFFNDAFPSFDLGSPFNLNEGLPSHQQDAGDDEVVPGEDPAQLLNCHKIWDKLASRQDFKDGTIDIDSLCSELRAKARCSESGVVVDQKDVDAALKRLPESKRI